MARFLAHRLALMLLTLWVASALLFGVTNVLPGDVGRVLLGPFAPQEAVDVLNRQLGLDRPLAIRYGAWLGDVVRGDWGRSYAFDTPVLPLVAGRLERSLLLAGFALVLLIPTAVGLGVAAALREGRLLDRVVSLGGLALGAIPEFVTGVVFLVVFAVWLRWLPASSALPEGAGPWEALRRLLLPAASLMLVLFSYLARMVRAGTLEALASDFTRTAVLKGLPRRAVVWRHVVRNALPPTVAVIGSQVGWLVGGLVVVETLFNYPGLGNLMLFAASNRDLPLLVGCGLVVTLVYMLGNLAADLIHAGLDPRVRHGLART
ncbi:ABC transporter permease [Limnochorda pilosa]|uniref:Peptide ABC transporter permease n=1 Tax=Limnochorda pilosa TaxID=1555112 RepID=A0A0K2SH92_LIMPI|nr:ABC transporter permease [Limnochorda pilosa]BAS26491.1 peptide ABC transporter permease [Limnochorda pilosa]